MRHQVPGSKIAAAVAAAMLLALSASAAMAAEPADKSGPARDEVQKKLEDAQKRLDAAAREVADLSMSLSDDVMPRPMPFMGMVSQRAVLGVNIGSGRTNNRDDGVEILSVSPGGAAAEAGLKAGDVLTELNGKSLKRDGEESPRLRLLSILREVDEEQKVAVKYLRDGKTATAQVLVQPSAKHVFGATMPFPPGPPGAMPRLDAIPGFAFMRAEGVFGAAELVPLTPKLGQYFGTDKGLLVVRAPADSRLKLEEGDVIVDIDGRVPASSSHALRILGSYQAGEQLKLNVLRMKKRVSFDITVPEDNWGGPVNRTHFRAEPPRAMPIPPQLPTPPAPPAPDAA